MSGNICRLKVQRSKLGRETKKFLRISAAAAAGRGRGAEKTTKAGEYLLAGGSEKQVGQRDQKYSQNICLSGCRKGQRSRENSRS